MFEVNFFNSLLDLKYFLVKITIANTAGNKEFYSVSEAILNFSIASSLIGISNILQFLNKFLC